MPDFYYRAIRNNGQVRQGVMQAHHEQDLSARLRDQELEIISTRRIDPSFWRQFLSQPPNAFQLQSLCLHLSELLKVGVPLLTALDDVRESTTAPRLRDALQNIHKNVSEGEPLSKAFQHEKSIFSQQFLCLLTAGEKTGHYATTFQDLADHIVWHEATKRQLGQALLYPFILLILAIGVIGFMMAYVTPQLIVFLQDSKATLPFLTTALISCSDMIQQHGLWVFLLLLLAGCGLWLWRYYSPVGRLFFDQSLFHIPLFGNLYQKMLWSRFSHMLSQLLQHGYGLADALREAKQSVTNHAFIADITKVEQDIQNGQSLAMALAATGRCPKLMQRMVSMGEQSGRLHTALRQVQNFYDREIKGDIERLGKVLEPGLMVLVGFIFLWIVLATIVPIYGNMERFGPV
jgi:type IV pilus assembly protein PilC